MSFEKQDWWYKEWVAGVLTSRLGSDCACICRDGRSWTQDYLVSLAKSGSAAWNEWHDSLERIVWYRQRSGERLFAAFLGRIYGADFRRVNFDGADITGIDFVKCNFSAATFRGSYVGDAKGPPFAYSPNFINCKFVGAKFSGVNFDGCSFERCDFTRAEIGAYASRTDFAGSKFPRAILSVSFRDSVLVGTDFADSHWVGVQFIDTDLSVANGLLQARIHTAPVLDHRTLWRSGPLPEEFYRMCGFPEAFVDYLPSLVQRAINLQSCFISYSAHDDIFARRLYTDLQKYKVRSFFAPKDLKIGSKIRDELEAAIHTRDKLLLVLSKHSIESSWVEYEVEAAIAREIREGRNVLFPITLDDEVFSTNKAWAASLRRQRHIGDFRNARRTDQYDSSLRKLLSDLAVEIE